MIAARGGAWTRDRLIALRDQIVAEERAGIRPATRSPEEQALAVGLTPDHEHAVPPTHDHGDPAWTLVRPFVWGRYALRDVMSARAVLESLDASAALEPCLRDAEWWLTEAERRWVMCGEPDAHGAFVGLRAWSAGAAASSIETVRVVGAIVDRVLCTIDEATPARAS